MLNLHNTSIENPAVLNGEIFDSKFCFREDELKHDIAQSLLISSVISYLFYDFETASKFMEIYKLLLFYVGVYLKFIFYFYSGLITIIEVKNRKMVEVFINAIE